MTTGTTNYVITPVPPKLVLNDGDQFVLIPHVDTTHHARLEVKDCVGDYPIVRWVDKWDTFQPVGDDFEGSSVQVVEGAGHVQGLAEVLEAQQPVED